MSTVPAANIPAPSNPNSGLPEGGFGSGFSSTPSTGAGMGYSDPGTVWADNTLWSFLGLSITSRVVNDILMMLAAIGMFIVGIVLMTKNDIADVAKLIPEIGA